MVGWLVAFGYVGLLVLVWSLCCAAGRADDQAEAMWRDRVGHE